MVDEGSKQNMVLMIPPILCEFTSKVLVTRYFYIVDASYYTQIDLDHTWIIHGSGQFITTSAEVTPNDGFVRESSQNGLKLG